MPVEGLYVSILMKKNIKMEDVGAGGTKQKVYHRVRRNISIKRKSEAKKILFIQRPAGSQQSD